MAKCSVIGNELLLQAESFVIRGDKLCLEKGVLSKNKERKALDLYTRGAVIFENLKKWEEAGKCFEKIATLQLIKRNSHEAVENFIKASNLHKKSNRPEAILCLFEAMNIHINSKDFHSASKISKNILQYLGERSDRLYFRNLLFPLVSLEFYAKNYFLKDETISFKYLFNIPKRIIKNTLLSYSYAEKLIRKAIYNDRSFPKTEIMVDLACCTYDNVECDQILDFIKKRLVKSNCVGQIYKYLIILNFLIIHGSEQVHLKCKRNYIYRLIQDRMDKMIYKFTGKKNEEEMTFAQLNDYLGRCVELVTA
ncbi:uncharacterized protein LOC136041400 [Artemia franciscana]|uniref:uncharacterized protein LOC136041400 n=1 Tax=Artemia franciscana TaxID=6661 RepID=UPI0032DAC908